jgi:hypothetical protein
MKLNLTDETKENIRVRAKAHINSTDPYYYYLTLHLLEAHAPELVDGLTCDERWERGIKTYKQWEASEYNDETRSHYECIEDYVQNL